jgi:hypothetical protein
MKRIVLSAILAVVVLAAAVRAQEAVQAQEVKSTTRVATQHNPPPYMEKNLATYERNLLATLANGTPTMQAQAVQTMRNLEQMFPKYPFDSLLVPLEKKLKDESTDPVVRRLAALALDELHSDAGDAIITNVASTSQDKGLALLCTALLIKIQYK